MSWKPKLIVPCLRNSHPFTWTYFLININIFIFIKFTNILRVKIKGDF